MTVFKSAVIAQILNKYVVLLSLNVYYKFSDNRIEITTFIEFSEFWKKVLCFYESHIAQILAEYTVLLCLSIPNWLLNLFWF